MNSSVCPSSFNFHRAMLDAMHQHVLAIDADGNILYTNDTWNNYAVDNEHNESFDWTTTNYLEICDAAANYGNEYKKAAAEGIRQVIRGELDSYYMRYPSKQRWFMLIVVPVKHATMKCIITHSDITARVTIEENLEKISRTDTLTNIPNRRHFNEFIGNEWARCKRLGRPISLAIFDLDYFKLVNDTYGHVTGDEYLRQISNILSSYTSRTSDLCARIGGEEFVLVLGNTNSDAALEICNALLADITKLNLPNKQSPVRSILTASAGLITMLPCCNNEHQLLSLADELLYKAKANGRNQLIFNTE